MKVKYPIVRIFIGAIVGLGLAALVGDPDSGIWFVIFLALGATIGICVGAIAEGIRHSNSVAQSLMKEKGMELEQLPATITDFIRLVIKKMRYRKKVRLEVMAELTAHFEDELKDCKSDEEKEQKVEELISHFGDARLLGVLLRRAKKRCQPLWRTMVARTFQAVGILILFFIIYVGWFLSGRPVISVNYLAQLNEMVRPTADESLNAAPLYIKATELYGKVSDDFPLFFAENYKEIADLEIRGRFRRREGRQSADQLANEIRKLFSNDKKPDFDEEKLRIQGRVAGWLDLFLAKRYRDTSAGKRKFIKKWIEDQKEPLDLVVAGAQKPYYWQKYGNKQNNSEMLSILLPELSKFRGLVQALCWRARLRAEQGRYQEAFEDLISCHRIGQHLKGDRTLVEQLVAIAIESLATQSLRDILSEHEIDSIVLTKLQKDLEQMVAGEGFVVSFATEKLFMYDVIQRCFTQDRFGGGHLCLQEFKELRSLVGYDRSLFEDMIEERAWTAPLHVLFTHPNKQQTKQMAERYYDFWNKMAHKTPAWTHSEGIDLERQSNQIIKGNILLEMFVGNFGRVIERSYGLRTEVQALVAITGLLRYKNDRGFYPENVNELMSEGYIGELPIDPWSDEPLVYRTTNDDFTLYSIGRNFKDDGGKVIRDDQGRIRIWTREGDAVFWPAPQPETPEEREKRLEK